MLSFLLFLIILACIGSLYRDGMWSNAIRLLCVVLAGLLATSMFEPIADGLEKAAPSYRYLVDFLSLWGFFVFWMVILRAATDVLSRVTVRFLGIADRIGSIAFATLVGWVMMSFTLMSLHTAPLGKNFMGGAFQPKEPMFLGMSPDAQWIGFVRMVSGGSYCCWNPKAFDSGNDFMTKYANRREEIQDHVDAVGQIRVGPEGPQKRNRPPDPKPAPGAGGR
jgi:hypothetical protein